MRLLDNVDRHIDCTTRPSTASCDCWPGAPPRATARRRHGSPWGRVLRTV